MRNALVIDGLDYWRRTTPEKAAVVMDGDVVAYAALGAWTDATAVRLDRLGVGPGDVVAIAGANSLEWVVGALAALKCGAAIAPFNTRFVRDELAHLVEVTEPKVVLADAPRAEILAQAAPGAAIVRMSEISQDRGVAVSWTAPRVPPQALALIVFTSGTTGYPKGVMFDHEALLANYFERKVLEPRYDQDMRHLFTLPLHVGAGTIWGFLPATIHGGTFHLCSGLGIADTLSALVSLGITHFEGPPVILDQIVQLPGFAEANLSALKVAHVGGSRVSLASLQAWWDKGVPLRQGYGMTELGGFVTMTTDAEIAAQAETCGHGGPFSRMRVARPDGSDCAAGEPGDVLLQGAAMMTGYWRNDEATAKAIVDGWIPSGDIGVYDALGNFKFVDRSKEMIISGGYNISPSEIERVIIDLDLVREVTVFPVPDAKFGETPAACVYADTAVDPKAIVAACCERLADFKVPRYVIVLDQPIPRNDNGKADRKRLTREYADAPARFPKLR